jgi:hypothetical protein
LKRLLEHGGGDFGDLAIQVRLTGFDEKILALYAKCRSCTSAPHASVAADLKSIYQSATVLEAEQILDQFEAKWGEKYPTIVKQWRLKWSDITAMFEFPSWAR